MKLFVSVERLKVKNYVKSNYVNSIMIYVCIKRELYFIFKKIDVSLLLLKVWRLIKKINV